MVGASLMANEIRWVEDYKTALALSKKEKKPVMLVATKSDCRYCKLLKETTFQDPSIIKQLNAQFINIKVQTDDEGATMPYMLAVYTRGFPTIWFLNEHGKALFQPIGGYMKPAEFKEALKIVTESYGEYLKNSNPSIKGSAK